ncbi:bile acid:sodium symporter family protein [Aliifodinibius sp. S!AR15-10]|uniref:bile acid:sodium symporter family protein n=1 Tax=Aliifodinibius sp. S!AR15-10 TaxID=2950437 RepID=UPI00285EE013|nr:bile acid:sodium symporter family protein [Aliifodinibius sp. S!AR15-10]MDR8391935.1 bile acid:sodium symporter family protein [Aliifodinibius sp. S!AR15-10]
MQLFRKICLGLGGISLLLLVIGLIGSSPGLWQASAVGLAVFLSIGIGAIPSLQNYQYTGWIIAAVVAGMIYPSAFLEWGDFDLRNQWVILIVVQLVMFGMGTQMSLDDFSGLASSGRGVLIGLLAHFSVMPLVGFGLTQLFGFEPEIAAGVILIGSCSGGLASNVMVYLARSNLVLSVTMTAMSTLVAPLMTPLLMKLLSGTLIEVLFVDMMMQIIKIVIIPIGAALLYDYLKKASDKGWRTVRILSWISAVWLLALPLGWWSLLETVLPAVLLQSAGMVGFVGSAILAGVGYHWLTIRFPKTDDFMPYISMFGIVYFTTVTTAAGREHLLTIGLLLFLAAVIHNTAGYVFGYGLARLTGLDKNSARAIAFEVGMQNGGMASGLAGSMGKLGTVGLASAVFSPWMNITGSILANYWKKRPVTEEESELETERQTLASAPSK